MSHKVMCFTVSIPEHCHEYIKAKRKEWGGLERSEALQRIIDDHAGYDAAMGDLRAANQHLLDILGANSIQVETKGP